WRRAHRGASGHTTPLTDLRWLRKIGNGSIAARAFGMATQSLEEVFARIRDGRMVVMVAEEHEDAEGDLVMAAEKITPDHVNFLAREARGIVSVAITDKRIRELGIPLAHSNDNGSSLPEQAGALIDAREGATTGISAGDRARVIQVVASPECGPAELVCRLL